MTDGRFARINGWMLSKDDNAGHHSDKHQGVGTSHTQHKISSRASPVDTHHKTKSCLTEEVGGALSSLRGADKVGHFLGGHGTVIADTYRVECDLGLGTFGRVVKCVDLKKMSGGRRDDDDRRTVAIKMVRNVKRYYDSAVIEARIVRNVNIRGRRGTSHFAIMHDSFSWRGHYCLVFESLGPSLFDYLKRNKYQPFPIDYVRDFSVQLLEAIDFLHSMYLIHTDCKSLFLLLSFSTCAITACS
jgi:dual-specificity kinase